MRVEHFVCASLEVCCILHIDIVFDIVLDSIILRTTHCKFKQPQYQPIILCLAWHASPLIISHGGSSAALPLYKRVYRKYAPALVSNSRFLVTKQQKSFFLSFSSIPMTKTIDHFQQTAA